MFFSFFAFSILSALAQTQSNSVQGTEAGMRRLDNQLLKPYLYLSTETIKELNDPYSALNRAVNDCMRPALFRDLKLDLGRLPLDSLQEKSKWFTYCAPRYPGSADGLSPENYSALIHAKLFENAHIVFKGQDVGQVMRFSGESSFTRALKADSLYQILHDDPIKIDIKRGDLKIDSSFTPFAEHYTRLSPCASAAKQGKATTVVKTLSDVLNLQSLTQSLSSAPTSASSVLTPSASAQNTAAIRELVGSLVPVSKIVSALKGRANSPLDWEYDAVRNAVCLSYKPNFQPFTKGDSAVSLLSPDARSCVKIDSTLIKGRQEIVREALISDLREKLAAQTDWVMNINSGEIFIGAPKIDELDKISATCQMAFPVSPSSSSSSLTPSSPGISVTTLSSSPSASPVSRDGVEKLLDQLENVKKAISERRSGGSR